MSCALQLFHTLQTIISSYSRLSVRKLIDHFLRIKIILQPTEAQVATLIERTDLPQPEKVVFLKSKQKKVVSYICVVIEHGVYLDLAPSLLAITDQCIVLEEGFKQENNILQQYSRQKQQRECRAVLLKIPGSIDSEQIISDLDSYLSVCELFHGHTHLIVNCFQLDPFQSLSDHLEVPQASEDELEGLQEGYLRITQERASRITLEELSETCTVERRPWGELLIFEGGQDGIIIWFTKDCLPQLGALPRLTLSPDQAKKYPHFCERPMGLLIFKAKEAFKVPMEELNFTTLIFNARKSQEIKGAQSELDFYCQTFFGERAMKREMEVLSTCMESGARLCEILEIDRTPVLQHLLRLL